MNKDERQLLRERIDRVCFDLVDAAARIVEKIASPPPALPAAPLAVARRQLANTLRLSQFCDLKACRRTRCCRGEPLHCLHIAVPLLPPEAFDSLLHKRPARSQRRRTLSARPREGGDPGLSPRFHNAASGFPPSRE